jgi:hypothetical protein
MKLSRYPIYVVGAIVIIFFFGVGLASKITINNSSQKQQQQVKEQTQNNVSVVFDGKTPTWGNEAIAIMAELEKWRNKAFTQNLQVEFKEEAKDGLAGWYDSQNKKLVVTTSGSERFGRGVMLHEIFHALQDQNFDLYTMYRQTKTPDAHLALKALVEGEAMLAVKDLMNYDFEAHAQLPPQGQISDELFLSLFQYGSGMKFLQAIRDQGGWEAVNAVFKDPPQSTTLIYHPDRYLAGERVIAATQPQLKAKEQIQAQEIRGEYEIRLWLARDPQTRSLVEVAGNAYSTDTLAIIKDQNNKLIHRWKIEFNNPMVAEQISLSAPLAMAYIPEASQNLKVRVEKNATVLEW